MQKRNLLLVKIGGGVITDKTERYALREEVLERVGREISEAWQELEETDLIVGNGAGSFAHYSAHEYRTAEGFVNERSKEGMGWVRHDAVKLNQIVVKTLLSKGVPVFSVSPSSCLRVAGGEVKEFFGKVINEKSSETFERMKIYSKNEEYIDGIIYVTKPDPQTTGKDLEILTKKHMTIAEAMESDLPEFNFMVKQRLSVFSKKIYSSLDMIPVLNS